MEGYSTGSELQMYYHCITVISKYIFIEWSQFLSDVGGAAGLVLGMSAATILGIFDNMFMTMISWLAKRSNKNKLVTTY